MRKSNMINVNWLLLIIITGLFLINPSFVQAKENVEIKDISVVEQSSTITVDELEIVDNNINSKISFNQLNDFVTLDIELENNSNIDYVLEPININIENEYVTAESEDVGGIIPKKSTKNIKVKLVYSKELLNHEDIVLNNVSMGIQVKDPTVLVNPVTGRNIIVFFIIIMIICVLSYYSIKTKKKKLLLLLLLIMPIYVNAAEAFKLNINFNNITIKGRYLDYRVVIDDGTDNIIENEITYGEVVGELPEVNKPGYDFEGWEDQNNNQVTEETIVTEELTIIPKLRAIRYGITYNLNGGELEEENPDEYTVEDEITLRNPEKEGYTFAGWSSDNGETYQTEAIIEKGTIGDMIFVASFSPNPDTKYTVIHNKMDMNGNYVEKEREELHGATDTNVTPQTKTYEGFTAPARETKNIDGNGKTTFVYNYSRNRYQLNVIDRTYLSNDSTANGEYYYETNITLKAQEREGYTFRWSDGDTNLERTFILKNNKTLTPQYTANTNTPYKVIHKLMNLDGETYTTRDEITNYGTTGEEIEPATNIYEGFTAPEKQRVTINGDGSTEIEYLYTRNKYTIAYENSEYIETETPAGEYFYGTSITITAKEREDYIFIKWNNEHIENPLTFTLNEDTTIEAIYNRNGYVITFDANGGEIEEETKIVEHGQEIGELPEATRDDYTLEGWYTSITDGLKVDVTYIPDGNMTLYAKWIETSDGYKYGFFNSEDILVQDYEVTDNCLNYSGIDSLTDDEKVKYCSKEVVENNNGTFSLERDVFDDGYALIKNNIIKPNSLGIDNTFNNYKKLKRYNFIKYNEDLSETYLCTLADSFNNTPVCFNGNNFAQEKEELKELFGEDNCDENEDSISCEIGDDYKEIECSLDSYGTAECEHEDGYYYDECYLNNDYFYCYGSRVREDDDSPFITELTTEGLAPLSYDISMNKCIKYYYGMFEDIDKTTAYCNGETVILDDYPYSLRQEISMGIEMYEEDGLVTNVRYGRPTSYEINYEGCKNYLHNEAEVDEEQIELFCTGNTATIYGEEFSLKEVIDEALAEGDAYELIEYENYGVIDVTYEDAKPDKGIVGYKGTPPKNLVIPSTLNGSRVVEIGWYAFQNMELESVEIPNTVKYIGSYAFKDNNITQINIPESVTYIGEYAFDNNNLNIVNLDNENVNVNYCSFGKKNNITTHNLPDNYYCETIYWALQDNDGDNTNETLVISNSEVQGNRQGSFEGNRYIGGSYGVPWINTNSYNSSSNLSYNVTNVKIEGELSPQSTAYWFNGVGYNSQTIDFDLASLDTSNTTNMSYMFAYAGYNVSEFELDLSKYNTSKVTNMNNMFNNCKSLTTIYASQNFTTDKVYTSNNMFTGDVKLIGGAGTVYNYSHIDKEYAHIDGGTSNPGYFTKGGSLTITLNPNGGNIDITSIRSEPGEEIGILPTPTREGYYFNGWFRGIDSAEEITEDYIVDNDTTIYAKWREPYDLNIIFDKNNDNATGEMVKQIVKEDTETTINDNLFVSDYYTFIGWNTKSDGTGTGYLNNDTIVLKKDIILYAQWINKYEIVFDKNNDSATGTMNIQRITEGFSENLLENNYILDGYAFSGWNTKSDGTGITYIDKEIITPTNNIVLYAQWVKTYTVTFSKNDDTAIGELYEVTSIHGATMTIPTESFVKYKIKDKMIDSYNTKSDFSGITYTKTSTIEFNEDLTLYAHWIETEINEKIYWALQDNDNDRVNETLVISDSEVSGRLEGNFAGDTLFSHSTGIVTYSIPWIKAYPTNEENLSRNVRKVIVEGTVVPLSTAGWFDGVGYNSSTFEADLTNLNMSKCNNLSSMFDFAGYNATTFELKGLDYWDTSNIISFAFLFRAAGENATTWNIGDLSDWDTSNVKSMTYMFSYGSSHGAGYNATTWDIGNIGKWDTSKVTDMKGMFGNSGYKATTWNIGDLSDWNTSNVTDMSYMLGGAGHSATIWNIGVLSNWDTSKVTNMSSMFKDAGTLANNWNIGDLSNWNTSNVKYMSKMFSYAGRNATIWDIGNIGNWDVSNVTDMSYMFEGICRYPSFDMSYLSDWDVSKVINMSYMFSNTGTDSDTYNLDLTNWNINKVTNVSYMFNNAGYRSKQVAINLDSMNTISVTDMNHMFNQTCENVDTCLIKLNNLNTSNVTNMSYLFGGLNGNNGVGANANTVIIEGLSTWDTSNVTNMSKMFSYVGQYSETWSIGDISNWDTSKVTNMSSMFSYMGYSATTFNLDLSNWDVSNVTNMNYMFDAAGYKATSWNIGDISNWDVSNVYDMSSIFRNTGYSATTFNLDLSNWDTSKVTNMSYMFGSAGYKATTFNLDLSNWDTSKVTNMSSVFSNTGYSATTFNLDLSNWDTSKVTNMSYMFSSAGYNATSWNIGNLSNWDTSKVTNMSYMFYCAGYNTNVFNLDLSEWDTSNVTNMSYMFSSIGYNATSFYLNLSGWNTKNVSSMNRMYLNVVYEWNPDTGYTNNVLYIYAGHNATNFEIIIPKTNGNGIDNTTSRMYGSTTSTYIVPPPNRQFTLVSDQ